MYYIVVSWSCAPAPNRERERAAPSTYLITFVCYGAWLPGQPGAVDRRHNVPGSPLPDEDPARLAAVRQHMKQEPYWLDPPRRAVVLQTLGEVCRWRRWEMLAAHVRTQHIHVVVQAEASPEVVMTTFKSYTSRALNQLGIDVEDRRRWARHGSTRYLWTRDELLSAIHYVVCEQGAPMAVYEAGDNTAP